MPKEKFFGFGTLVSFWDKFFNAIHIVLTRLSLYPLLTVGLVWLALKHFLPPEKTGDAFDVVFLTIGIVCFIYAIFATIYNVFCYIKSTPNRKKQKKTREINMEDIAEAMNSNEPVYYRVAQNPQYIVAEYSDRNELYYDDNGEMKFVKMTLKKKEDS